MIKSLYIHIPFCDNICSYCDFTRVQNGFFSQKLYIENLINEINNLNIEDNSLSTIYIGGGTPSSLHFYNLKRLLSYLNFHFKNVKEFTIECNPESVNESKVKLFKEYKINRISLGVESSNRKYIKELNRKHTNNKVIKAVSLFNKYGIDNYNLDFIYGNKGMTIEDVDHDINFAFSLNPKHLSFYSLQIEENTLLYLNKYEPLNNDKMSNLYKHIVSRLNKKGYKRYEVSNFAKKNYESLHNLTYWHDEEYYASGVSASSYIGNKRITNTKSLTSYLKNINNQTINIIDKKDEEFEFLMLNLRLVNGFKITDFNSRFKKDFLTSYKDEIEKVKDYTEIKNGRFYIKNKYIYTMDNILLEILK